MLNLTKIKKKSCSLYLEEIVTDKIKKTAIKQERSESQVANTALKKGLGLKDANSGTERKKA